MLLILLGLGLVAVWALARLGRQTEKAGSGHWRITATVLGAALFAGAIFALSRGSWLAGAGMALGGLWLVVQSRIRSAPVKAPRGSEMSLSEARSVLGVSEGASRQEIQAAWKRLMGRAHPDQGGTEGLAVRVNAARDRLLKG
jgi:hypothetical protein